MKCIENLKAVFFFHILYDFLKGRIFICFRLLIRIQEDIASYLGRVTGYSYIIFHGFFSTSS